MRTLDWEQLWAPYDETTYGAALEFIQPDDVVLDIGAGDLRFACQAAARARAVIAIERRADLLPSPVGDFPDGGRVGDGGNLTVICGDALATPFPDGITVGVLLMRHCYHFAEYVAKLRVAGCWRLITNARWGMDVETVSLAPQPSFAAISAGWYACVCGSVGFKPCQPESVTLAVLARTTGVETCPDCLGTEI